MYVYVYRIERTTEPTHRLTDIHMKRQTGRKVYKLLSNRNTRHGGGGGSGWCQ